MTDSLRITVDQLRKRMDSGDDFTILDTRNPEEWAKSDVKMPEAIRVTAENRDVIFSNIPEDKPIVAYCT